MFKAIPLCLCALVAASLVESRTENEPFVSGPIRQARHVAQVAHGFVRELRLALDGLSPKRRSQTQLVERASHRQCQLLAPQNNRGGGGSSPPSGVNETSPLGSTASRTSHATPTATVAPSPFEIMWDYSGNDFFTEFDFNTGSDPTHGVVDYLTASDAQSSGLAFVNSNGNFVMQVDTTPVVSNLRKSIRITTSNSFNGGLLLMDAVHIPTGCGTWPAWWTNGPDWPNNGEIDIVEGISNYTDNQATVHTAPGCTMPSSFNDPTSFSQVATGQLVGGTNCASAETNNQGCGIRVLDSTSFGPGFNSNGGGVYAMLWTSDGISVYFFGRNKIPTDIAAGQPNPDNWGLPDAMWPASNCNPSTFFKDHVAIFDTTLCGDWAGSAWSTSGIPGQEQSCAARTSTSSCTDYVLNNGGSFEQAYWEVSYVKLYQPK